MTPAIRVLYAEDNAQDADLTLNHFAEKAPEFEIAIVETGARCLDELRENRFDLLLLDNHLPDMDGLDVLKTLVRDELRQPVVMVTGVGDEGLVVKALRLGAASYVPKQADYLDSLPDVLRGVLEEYRQGRHRGSLAAGSSRKILYVEHHPMDVELTLRHFADAAPHFVVDAIQSTAEALARLELAHDYDLVLLDLRMPGMNGLEFAREAKRRHLRLPPFVVISGQGDDATAIATLKLGATDYIAKRDGYLDQLVYTIDQAIAADRLSRANELLQTELAERTRVEERLRRSVERLNRLTDAAVSTLARTVEMRDPYTAGHQERVAGLSLAIGERLRLHKRGLTSLRIAALIHDLGKIALPAEILSKPGALSAVEWQLIRRHPETGYEILREMNFPGRVATIVRQHHERLDGSGYPHGLQGEQILIASRVIAVADVVEAMASHRPYRAALGIDVALEEVDSKRGALYDPAVVDACLTLFRLEGFRLPASF